MNRIILLLALVTGCWDSLVSNPCASGYTYATGQCSALQTATDADTAAVETDGGSGTLADAGVDGAGDAGTDAAVDGGSPADALVCTAPEVACSGTCTDVTSDPDNCGACNLVCASGICQSSACVGDLLGHIITIGHDYQSHNGSMRRVLGNAVALGQRADVGVARYRGTAAPESVTGTTAALTQAMSSIGRTWHAVSLPAMPSPSALDDVDVLVVEAQTGDGDAAFAAGQMWAAAIDDFVQRGGVVVLLEGIAGVSYRFAEGASLYVQAAPLDATGTEALIANGSDALAQHVVAPYLADTTSTAIPGATGVIVTPVGAVVVHITR